MADLPDRAEFQGGARRGDWINRLVSNPSFQSWAARLPILRRIVRAEGAAIFDLVQGFVQSQALFALVDLNLMHHMKDGPQSVDSLSRKSGVPADRMQILLQAGAAMGLLKRRRDGGFALAPRGAAFAAVPGLADMVRHHAVLYRDLADPVAFLRGQTTPELAGFWPYVFGAGVATDPQTAARYSQLMADSQALVAEDVLNAVSLGGVSHLCDVGGGTGAFLSAVAQRYPTLSLTLFDLPAVLGAARDRLGAASRIRLHAGSFRDDPLPAGCDAISLVRVLYDHADATVALLLSRVFEALPPGGRIILAEPMSGGSRPDPVTDVYFAFYTLAMGTGRTRSAATLAMFLQNAGFVEVSVISPRRSYVTGILTARRP